MFLKRYLKLRPDDAYTAQQLSQLTGERALQARAPKTAELVAGIKKGGFAAHTGLKGAPTRQAISSLPPAELLDLAPVATRRKLPALLVNVAMVLAAVGVLVYGFRKLSRSIDEEAKSVMEEDRAAARSLETRIRPDGGVVP